MKRFFTICTVLALAATLCYGAELSTVIQTNFTAGELSPKLLGRPDFQKYYNGARELTNWLIYLQGGITRRPGTYYVSEVKDSSDATRLVAFEFSSTQAYILEFGDLYIRFYKDKGQIVSGSSAYEISTPYASSDIWELRFTQSADTLYIVHPDYAPRKLTRTGHTSWTLSTINFLPPAMDERDVAGPKALTPGATTGEDVTFTASSSCFLAGDEGRQIVYGTSRAVITEVTGTTTAVCDIVDDWSSTSQMAAGAWYFRGTPSSYIRFRVGKREGSIMPIEGRDDTNENYQNTFRSTDVGRYILANNGVFKITSYENAYRVNCEVLRELDYTDYTNLWLMDDEVWSSTLGYPSTVTFYENRLMLGGSAEYPQTVWGSVVDDYESFIPGSDDADSYSFTLLSRAVNTIRWLETGQVLYIGTMGAEWRLGDNDLQEPTTPTNVYARQETNYGSADIQALQVENAVLFVQRGARRIREYAYVYSQDAYSSPDLSLLADHLFDSDIVDMAYQKSPQSMLYVVLASGKLAVLTYDRSNEVVGWQSWVTDGAYQSVAVIPGETGGEDEVWVIVRRQIGSTYKRYVEYFKPQNWGEDHEDAFFVDCGLTYSGSSTSTVTGLSHLNGKTVALLVDGATQTSKKVVSGSVTLDQAGRTVQAGLPFTSTVETLPIAEANATAFLQGKQKNVHQVLFRLLSSLGGQAGPDSSHLDTLDYQRFGMTMGAAPDLFTGDMPFDPRSGWGKDGTVYLTNTTPQPMTVLAIIRDYGVGMDR